MLIGLFIFHEIIVSKRHDININVAMWIFRHSMVYLEKMGMHTLGYISKKFTTFGALK